MDDRVRDVLRACTKYGVAPPDEYANWFAPQIEPPRSEKDRFLIELADAARSSVVDTLIDHAKQIADDANMPSRSHDKMQKVLNAFKLLTPVAAVGDLTNILNAAWQAFEIDGLWGGIVANRIDALNELVLKSIEILEFENRVHTTHDT